MQCGTNRRHDVPYETFDEEYIESESQEEETIIVSMKVESIWLKVPILKDSCTQLF